MSLLDWLLRPAVDDRCPMCYPGAKGQMCLGHPGNGCSWCKRYQGGPLCLRHQNDAKRYGVKLDENGRITRQD